MRGSGAVEYRLTRNRLQTTYDKAKISNEPRDFFLPGQKTLKLHLRELHNLAERTLDWGSGDVFMIVACGQHGWGLLLRQSAQAFHSIGTGTRKPGISGQRGIGITLRVRLSRFPAESWPQLVCSIE